MEILPWFEDVEGCLVLEEGARLRKQWERFLGINNRTGHCRKLKLLYSPKQLRLLPTRARYGIGRVREDGLWGQWE